MKKIDKENHKHATEYHTWLESLDDPPKYYSSHKYYKDILVNLLCCQGGLCAYTEFRLIDLATINTLPNSYDANGKFQGERPEVPADIEHFCSETKTINAWEWSNLFAAFSSINRDIKRVREDEIRRETGSGVKKYLKPDDKDYAPDKYLEYDYDEHRFNPRLDLEENIAKDVANMIYVLGLNYGFIKMKRKEYLSLKIEQLKAGKKEEIDQFHTSYEFSRISLNLPEL